MTRPLLKLIYTKLVTQKSCKFGILQKRTITGALLCI